MSRWFIIYSPVQPGAGSNQVGVIEILFIVTKYIRGAQRCPLGVASNGPAAYLNGQITSTPAPPGPWGRDANTLLITMALPGATR